jgi:protein kinase-like protein/PASTA domain-containing protein
MDDRVMLGQGDRVAGYEVESVIAKGGMGVVYRAHQVGLGRSVALKVIAGERAEDPLFRARFVREARLAASLDHPNVIPIFAAGEDEDGELFIAMRLVDGSDLQRLIARSGPLEAGLAARIVGQAAAGLAAAHALGLVHRDVKPANILLSGPPENPHVYVSDFGVAKSAAVADGELTNTSEWIGTPGYAAPEQVRGGEVDARADVYALGCVLLAALGRGEPGARPALPVALDAVIARATAVSPAARFQSVGELADALLAAVRPAELAPATVPRPLAPAARAAVKPARPRRARRPGWAGAGFGVGFLVIVAGVVVIALTRAPGAHPARATTRPPARALLAPPTPAAAGGGDTVFCGASSCSQSGRPVLVPIEGGSCARGAVAGTWTRLDSGAPEPMLICLPADDLPRVSVAVAVPTLTGGRLDHAETALDRLGIPYRTSGGGLFGIISSSDWTVCATSPPAGAELPPASQVTVFVEHSC